jgi:hypothetical protein
LRENEQLGDVLSWWEKRDSNYKFVFKKKVFLDPKEVVVDPVADYLLFHQVMSSLLYLFTMYRLLPSLLMISTRAQKERPSS